MQSGVLAHSNDHLFLDHGFPLDAGKQFWSACYQYFPTVLTVGREWKCPLARYVSYLHLHERDDVYDVLDEDPETVYVHIPTHSFIARIVCIKKMLSPTLKHADDAMMYAVMMVLFV